MKVSTPRSGHAVELGIQELKNAGAEIVPISLPHTAYAIPTLLRRRNGGGVVESGAL